MITLKSIIAESKVKSVLPIKENGQLNFKGEIINFKRQKTCQTKYKH